MVTDLSSRLRELRDRNNWTVADMAERTGLPKRTLDKYMLRDGASLPGFDALCALSKGLGVSLDWLVFGADFASEGIELIAYRAADHVVTLFAVMLVREFKAGRTDLLTPTSIGTLSPEEWGMSLGNRAGEFAAQLVREGLTREGLLNWRQSRNDRAFEFTRARSERMVVPDEK